MASGGVRADGPAGCTNAPDEVHLRLSFTGLHSDAGNLTITIYPDDAKRFLAKGGKLFKTSVPAHLPVTTACVLLPAPGHYAVSAYHDEDNDHRFKRTLLGLPDEGYGFSNNPKSLIGLPSFSAVRVEANAGDNPFEIRINY
ncbi:MAG: hypothetical protein NVS9B10_05740 [Nevskia sp.]